MHHVVALVVGADAVGWSGYAVHSSTGGTGPVQGGGIVNLPAVFIIAVVAGPLSLGTREGARINDALVC